MIRTTFRSVPAPIFLLLVTAPLLLALTATAAEAASPSGACVSARIEASFRLPDGSVHDAATLTMCEAKAFSPVATVHRTYVNGRPAGMFVSKIRQGEATESDAPSVVFQRDGDGRLDLLGYVLPGRGRDVAYQFGMLRHTRAAAPALATSAGSVAAAGSITLVVAAK